MSEEQHVDLDDAVGWIAGLKNVKAKIAELEQIKKAIEEQIKHRLGDAPEGRLNGRPIVRWAWTKPVRRVDTKALKEAGLYDQYSKEAPGVRRFVLLDADEREGGR